MPAYSYYNHRMYYTVTGHFSPYIVPCELMKNFVTPISNCQERIYTWKDKNYANLMLPKAPFPKTIIHNIRGCLFDEQYDPIDETQADALLKNAGEFIVKGSLDNGGGRGVQKLSGGFDVVKASYKSDYIVQAVLKQHKDIARLNESSVNIVRLMTMLLDGKPEYIVGAIRVGDVGFVTDCGCKQHGHGNVIIGLTREGVLHDEGYEMSGQKVNKTANGTVFAGMKIPNYDKMVELALKCQAKMPFFRFIGWDMAVTEDGNPTIIEYNIGNPGTIYYQWTNGLLFGTDPKRIQEIIEKLRK